MGRGRSTEKGGLGADVRAHRRAWTYSWGVAWRDPSSGPAGGAGVATERGGSQASARARAPARPDPRPLPPLEQPGARRRAALELCLLALLVLLSRAPFLDAGFGRDEDAWRIASASREIALGGGYQHSRPPGYPVPELVGALVWRGGAPASNALSALACTAAAAAIFLYVRRTRPRAALPAALAFAFTPVVHIASTSTMDHLWAQAFGSTALLLAAAARPTSAGLALGLAIGSRLPTGVLLPAVALLLLGRGAGLRAALRAGAIALGLAALLYAPAFLVYGLAGMAPDTSGDPSAARVLRIATELCWGQIGTYALALASILALVAGLHPTRVGEIARERLLLGSALLIGALLAAAVFLWMPYEPGYLVPFVALLVPWLALRLPVSATWSLAASLALSCFLELRQGRALPGPVLQDRAARSASLVELERLLDALRSKEPDAVLIAGGWEPLLRYARGPGRAPGPECVLALGAEQAAAILAEGRALYFVNGIEAWHRREFSVGPRRLGAVPLLED